jgi:hypothetical protein
MWLKFVHLHFLKGSQDVADSDELVSSTTLPTSDTQEDQSNPHQKEKEDQSKDDDGKMMAEEGHIRTNMTEGVVEESQLVGREREREREKTHCQSNFGTF